MNDFRAFTSKWSFHDLFKDASSQNFVEGTAITDEIEEIAEGTWSFHDNEKTVLTLIPVDYLDHAVNGFAGFQKSYFQGNIPSLQYWPFCDVSSCDVFNCDTQSVFDSVSSIDYSKSSSPDFWAQLVCSLEVVEAMIYNINCLRD